MNFWAWFRLTCLFWAVINLAAGEYLYLRTGCRLVPWRLFLFIHPILAAEIALAALLIARAL